MEICIFPNVLVAFTKRLYFLKSLSRCYSFIFFIFQNVPSVFNMDLFIFKKGNS